MKSRLLACLFALAFAFSCAVTSERSDNPVFNTENDPILIPEAEEQVIGAQAAAQVAKEFKTFGDASVQAYVRGVGARLARAGGQPGIRFTVLEDKMVNAFALPGGHVYVTTGLLARFKDEAELAAVLGHETGHVLKKHGLKRLQRQVAASQSLDILLSLLSENKAKFLAAFAGPATQLLFLRNSREAELEADEQGLRLNAAVGLDPAGMIGVQEMLLKAGGGANALFGDMLSTHPASEGRIIQAKALLPRFAGPADRGAERYKAAVLDHLK